MSATCAKCGHNRADVNLTAIGIDLDAPIIDDILIIDRATLTEADTIQVEAACTICGHVRYILDDQWSWA